MYYIAKNKSRILIFKSTKNITEKELACLDMKLAFEEPVSIKQVKSFLIKHKKLEWDIGYIEEVM